MTNEKTVAFVLGCVDCRHHVPEAGMIDQLKNTLGVDDVYLCTTAGPDGKLCAQGVSYQAAIEDACTIRDAKGATVFAVLGHYQCAGHPVSDEQHDHDTRAAAQLLANVVGIRTHALVFVPEIDKQPTWTIKSVGVCEVSETEVA